MSHYGGYFIMSDTLVEREWKFFIEVILFSGNMLPQKIYSSSLKWHDKY
jgi:hypothetical protein